MMQEFKKFIIILAMVVGLILIIFNENIRGYYRFKAICEKESGLRVYQKLEQGVGWLADSYSNARYVATIQGVGFVRYVGQDGITYDLRYLKGHPGDDTSFDKKAADLTKPVLYSFKFVLEDIQGELRLARAGFEIRDVRSLKHDDSMKISTAKLVARIYRFDYSRFDQDKTILAAPSRITCSSYHIETPENRAQLFK
ncbi:hypothetical protein [Chitinibacter tainanensis]|uniref:hypothetical protein n=1 Tax=Chitinibacter tainanensis TaxID=230667 RepID=UPI00048DAC2A|nr:hypothetical protein [Chitinibacter tainanensis]